MIKLIYKSVLLFAVLFSAIQTNAQSDSRFISYTCNAKNIQLHWKNKNNNHFGSIGNLISHLQNTDGKPAMVMNGGMYLKDHSPQGLYIEKGQVLKGVNTTKSAYGNFYMQPNGVFYITKKDKAVVCITEKLPPLKDLKYATQSGPMAVINGKINSKFTKGSKNLNIRNGVGILPSGEVIFTISTEKVNLYDFANFFKQKGCKYALYLDGFVSKMYLSTGEIKDIDGNFGVLISSIE